MSSLYEYWQYPIHNWTETQFTRLGTNSAPPRRAETSSQEKRLVGSTQVQELSRIVHEILKFILHLIADSAEDGIKAQCEDEVVRRCYASVKAQVKDLPKMGISQYPTSL